MRKKLITLKEHNKNKRDNSYFNHDPKPNGIACPDCGSELWDIHPNIILASLPPKKSVECRKCKYKGTRLA